MSKRKLEIFVHILNVLFIAAFLAIYLNQDFPNVGHDYGYFISNLLDGLLHYRINGFSIQWYTPSFGGGLPSYPNPQQIQFSLPQVLTFFFNPWNAIVISTVLFALVGYFAMSYFLSRTLRLGWQAGVLGGLFFSLNGFYIEHMAVGHLGFQTFPLLPLILIGLFSVTLPESLAAILIAGVFAVMVYAAGFFPIAITLLTLLISIPAIYILYPENFQCKRLVQVGISGLILTGLLVSSKMTAVYSFMRFFPREISDNYTVNPLIGLVGIFVQLLGTMNLIPFFRIGGLNPNLLTGYMVNLSGAAYRFWEFDISMSPVVILLVIVGIYSLLRKPKKILRFFLKKKKWIAGIFLFLFTWLTIEFILAKGLIYPLIRNLPILSSLHVNPRFTAAFIFPLALLAVFFYHRKVLQYSPKKASVIFLIVNVLTLLFLLTYFSMPDDFQERIYSIPESLTAYRLIRTANSLHITGIADNLGETQALSHQMSNLYPNETIFGYGLENFHPEVKAGSIWDVSGSYYNMTNPTGYVFPEINGTHPFERISLDEKRELEDFANHKQPDWKIPLYQQIADWASGLTALAILLYLAFFATGQLILRMKMIHGHQEDSI